MSEEHLKRDERGVFVRHLKDDLNSDKFVILRKAK